MCTLDALSQKENKEHKVSITKKFFEAGITWKIESKKLIFTVCILFYYLADIDSNNYFFLNSVI